MNDIAMRQLSNIHAHNADSRSPAVRDLALNRSHLFNQVASIVRESLSKPFRTIRRLIIWRRSFCRIRSPVLMIARPIRQGTPPRDLERRPNRTQRLLDIVPDKVRVVFKLAGEADSHPATRPTATTHPPFGSPNQWGYGIF
jgi:hypothetical protein